MPATAWDADASSPPPPPPLRLIRRRGERSVPPVDPPDCEPCYGLFRGVCSSLPLISMPCRAAPVGLGGSRWATSSAQEINRSFTGKVVAGEFPFPAYFVVASAEDLARMDHSRARILDSVEMIKPRC